MKKWKVIRNITGILLLMFALGIALLALAFALDDGPYPHPDWGVSRWEAFAISAGIMLVWLGGPLLAVGGFFIVSIIQIKEYKKGKH